MKAKRLEVSEDLLNGAGNSSPIPTDLIIELFSRLPVKSIARCRCLSKLWASILRLPYFTELYLTNSSARPRLLFACQNADDVSFFSSPYPQNLDGENSSLLTTNYHMKNYHMKFPETHPFRKTFHAIGLVLVRDKCFFKAGEWLFVSLMICNPSTGQSMTLPKLKARTLMASYLGYDPIAKQYKVLSMPLKSYGHQELEYHVLTLGTGELSWRRFECCIQHSPSFEHIYINGVLYYIAETKYYGVYMLACFDFKSEKFNFIEHFIKHKESFMVTRECRGLINYNGKLGLLTLLQYKSLNRKTKGIRSQVLEHRCIKLQVLEDVEKQEWSSHTYALPTFLWQNTMGNIRLYFVGMTGTNEIVLSPSVYQQDVPFCIFYYNTEKKTITTLRIQGLEAFPGKKVDIFLDHVEDLNLL